MNIEKAYNIIEQHAEALDHHYGDIEGVDYKNNAFIRKAKKHDFDDELTHQSRHNTVSKQLYSAEQVSDALKRMIQATEKELLQHGIIQRKKQITKVDKLPKKQNTPVRF